jgi:hypothetical protein
MTRLEKPELLLVAAVAATALVVVVALLISETSTAPSDSKGETRVGIQALVREMPGIQQVVNGAPHVIGCRDRGRDTVCRIQGPTGLRAMCFVPKRNPAEDASCSRFETP